MMLTENYLVFGPGELWIARFLKYGFGHIFIVGFDGINWILFNPSITHFEWEILPIYPEENPFEKYFSGMTVVEMNEISYRNKWVGRLGIMSCVLFAKYYFGIKSFSLTPRQLYKYVIRNKLGVNYGRKIWCGKKSRA